MKKKLFYLSAILICLSIISGSTLAFYTSSDTAHNVITSGGVAVKVVEQQLINGVLKPYPNQPIPVLPTAAVSKIVSAQSTEQEAWIRMNYTVTVYDPDGNKMDIAAEELERVIVIEPDTADWTRKNGWWYYNTVVGSGEMTTPLFEQVTFSGPDMDNKYQLCTAVIDVNAQAVQYANNGSDVMEAMGWSEN